ncbi:MAG: alpha/beta fold hydrolase [Spirochaetales bacterium]|nr:alpha/beta fold hydrolase [Spirochaetales bacterium]
MDKRSSIFVDQLAMEKLVEEKLSKVHHAPESHLCEKSTPLYGSFPSIPPTAEWHKKVGTHWQMISPVEYSDENNHLIPITISPADIPHSSIILVHGLYEDNREIYQFLIKNLNNLGYTIYQTTLPYHYDRTPPLSSFSGEYFWSANIDRTKRAFEQAVAEIYQLINDLKSCNNHPVNLLAFSMGGGVTLSLLSLVPNISKVFLLNSICSLSAVVWDSPLCKTIKNDLLIEGYSLEEIVEAYSSFEPLDLLKQHSLSDRVALGYGLYDQITSVEQYEGLIKKLNLNKTFPYKSGHLNTLRVPRIARDIHAFFSAQSDSREGNE